jgi:hypothetical protein
MKMGRMLSVSKMRSYEKKKTDAKLKKLKSQSEIYIQKF